jgi:hypothetical protein
LLLRAAGGGGEGSSRLAGERVRLTEGVSSCKASISPGLPFEGVARVFLQPYAGDRGERAAVNDFHHRFDVDDGLLILPSSEDDRVDFTNTAAVLLGLLGREHSSSSFASGVPPPQDTRPPLSPSSSSSSCLVVVVVLSALLKVNVAGGGGVGHANQALGGDGRVGDVGGSGGDHRLSPPGDGEGVITVSWSRRVVEMLSFVFENSVERRSCCCGGGGETTAGVFTSTNTWRAGG